MTKVVLAIPARLNSSRLPNKVLLDIAGIPMVVRVAMQCLKTKTAINGAKVLIISDSEQVLNVAKRHNIDTTLTGEHNSGSERCAELASIMNLKDSDIVVNIQGDEPLIAPENIDYLVDKLTDNDHIQCATLYENTDINNAENPNAVKVVISKSNKVLYFSRSVIPHIRSDVAVAKDKLYNRHIGIYGYKVALLKKYLSLESSILEATEKLEQLKLLENDINIYAYQAIAACMPGIDTAEDLSKISTIIYNKKNI